MGKECSGGGQGIVTHVLVAFGGGFSFSLAQEHYNIIKPTPERFALRRVLWRFSVLCLVLQYLKKTEGSIIDTIDKGRTKILI